MAYFDTRKCRGCIRFVPPRELVTGLCGYCWRERLAATGESISELQGFTDGEIYRCMECKRTLNSIGYWQWVKDAARYAFLCLECGDKKIQTDEQYRGTPFALNRGIR